MNTNLIIPGASAISHQPASANSHRKISLTAGLLYLLTFISIPTFALYGSVRDANNITGPANNNAIITGGLLEITVALAGIATAIVLYPLLKKQSESLALGLVASRVLEAATIFVGVAFLLSVVTLQQSGTGNETLSAGHVLVALYDRIFTLGQGLIPAIDDLLLGTLLYKSRLVPRTLSLIGIMGAFLLLGGFTAIMFGYIDRLSPWAGLSALPVAGFEFSLGVYLVVKGFKTDSALLTNS